MATNETPALFPVERVQTGQCILPTADLLPLAVAIGGPLPGPDLVRSVSKLGVLQPVLVRMEEKKVVQLLAGRRRVLAAHQAGLEMIPCAAVLSVEVLSEVVTLAENLSRKQNPYSEYEAIQSLVARGHDLNSIASQLGIPMGIVKKRLAWSNLPEPILRGLADGKIKATVGDAIAKLAPSYRKLLAKTYAKTEKLTYNDVEEVRTVVRDKAKQIALPEMPSSSIADELAKRYATSLIMYAGGVEAALALVESLREPVEVVK